MAAETPRIQFATAEDGVRIAYTVAGSGEPLVCTPSWVSHQELEWIGPGRDFSGRLAQSHQLILFDGRGTGLSDRNVDDTSVPARLRDLEAVVRHLDLERFVLLGMSQWSPVALSFAARYPERIRRFILYAPFSEGFISDAKEGDALGRALLDLMRAEWGVGARATMGFVHPDADRQEEQAGLQYLREASTGEVAARILEEGMFEVSISHLLPEISIPTLVMHRRGDNAIPVECGRRVASLLPNARFLPLDGDHHLPFQGDVESLLSAIHEFLGVEVAPPAPAPARGSTWQIDSVLREAAVSTVTLLFTDIEGSTTLTDRLGDASAQALLRTHNDIVRDALAAHGGSEIKHTGDGIMASFAAASRALECTVHIQRTLARHNEEHPEHPIAIRVGLNAGEPVQEEGDLFGTSVQLARRICDRAEPGQILVSNVVRELAAGKGFLFSDIGEEPLRGFEDPVRLFEVRWAES